MRPTSAQILPLGKSRRLPEITSCPINQIENRRVLDAKAPPFLADANSGIILHEALPGDRFEKMGALGLMHRFGAAARRFAEQISQAGLKKIEPGSIGIVEGMVGADRTDRTEDDSRRLPKLENGLARILRLDQIEPKPPPIVG